MAGQDQDAEQPLSYDAVRAFIAARRQELTERMRDIGMNGHVLAKAAERVDALAQALAQIESLDRRTETIAAEMHALTREAAGEQPTGVGLVFASGAVACKPGDRISAADAFAGPVALIPGDIQPLPEEAVRALDAMVPPRRTDRCSEPRKHRVLTLAFKDAVRLSLARARGQGDEELALERERIRSRCSQKLARVLTDKALGAMLAAVRNPQAAPAWAYRMVASAPENLRAALAEEVEFLSKGAAKQADVLARVATGVPPSNGDAEAGGAEAGRPRPAPEAPQPASSEHRRRNRRRGETAVAPSAESLTDAQKDPAKVALMFAEATGDKKAIAAAKRDVAKQLGTTIAGVESFMRRMHGGHAHGGVVGILSRMAPGTKECHRLARDIHAAYAALGEKFPPVETLLREAHERRVKTAADAAKQEKK